jgi:hypothetical protein
VLVEDCCGTTSPDFCREATLWNVKFCFGFVTDTDGMMKGLPAWDELEDQDGGTGCAAICEKHHKDNDGGRIKQMAPIGPSARVNHRAWPPRDRSRSASSRVPTSHRIPASSF